MLICTKCGQAADSNKDVRVVNGRTGGNHPYCSRCLQVIPKPDYQTVKVIAVPEYAWNCPECGEQNKSVRAEITLFGIVSCRHCHNWFKPEVMDV
jgi:NAD-dependent SIR2 family protein deacetylase